jgi:hypothetical protein
MIWVTGHDPKGNLGHDPKPVLTHFSFSVMTRTGHDPKKKKLGHDRFWVMTQKEKWVMTATRS